MTHAGTTPALAGPTPEPRRISVGGLTFEVRSSLSAGSGRPAFVLIHGIGVSHRYLARLHRELAETSEVHSLDLPGFGRVPKPGSAVTVAQMAAGIAGVLEDLGLSDVVLVGHSMGAQWVIELAVQRPDLASSVIVIGPVTDDEHRTATAQSLALAVDTAGEPIDGNVMVFTDYLRCGPRWYLTQLRQMVSYPIEDRVAELVRPLLIIRGGNDPIAGQAWTRRLRDRAKLASLVTVPGHRHLVQHTAPRAVALAIGSFLGGIRT